MGYYVRPHGHLEYEYVGFFRFCWSASPSPLNGGWMRGLVS